MILDSKQLSGPCSCGRTHEMMTKKLVVEPGCLKNFDSYLDEMGLTGKRAIIYDSNTYNAKGVVRPSAWQEIILPSENLHANERAVNLILEQLSPEAEVLVALGAGTVHDATRYCANDRKLPFVSCPTAASVDGFCSTVSAMTWGGFKLTLPGVAPVIVIADVDVIRQAPMYLALSGVGDIIGKYTSLADWRIAHAITDEFICPVIHDLTQKAVDEVYSCCRSLKTGSAHAFEQLTYGLLLSGLAMQMMGNSRPASAAEHHISHVIEMEIPAIGVHSDALHGEKVGVGTLIVSDVYHRIAAIEDIAPHIKPYQPLSADMIKKSFGKTAESILKENANDSLALVSPEALISNWGAVREAVSKIPAADELYSLYTEIGAKKSLEDIGVPEALLPDILRFAPMVRNRLSLMRIRRMLDI